MRLYWLVLACSTAAFAQSFEASVSGGKAIFPKSSANIGSDSTGAYTIADGLNLTLRMTLNSWRFMGHEFGYAYNHTSIDVPTGTGSGTGTTGTPVQPGASAATPSASSSLSVPAHQGFYNFLVYAAPEGFRARPFATGGVNFTAFSTPGSGSYGNRETKYGINYGGGLKIKVKEPWGVRFDVRQFNMGKPFSLPNASGRLLMWEFTGGISFLL